MAYTSKSWRDTQGRPRDPSLDLEQTIDNLKLTVQTRQQRIKVAKDTGKWKRPILEEAEKESLTEGSATAVILLRGHLNSEVKIMKFKVYITWGVMVVQWIAIAELFHTILKDR